MTDASPPSVSNVVRSTMVPSRYSRRPWPLASTEVIEQWPPVFQSSSLPNTLPESIRGMQHQSTEPLALTRAIEWQLLRNA
jgi:hypothetical protein